MRQTFVEWATQSINKSYWAGAYYRQQSDKGSTYQAAVRSLAFKWIRIVYRCWQTGEAYDESRYLKVLDRHWYDNQRLPWFEVADNLPRYQIFDYGGKEPTHHGPK